MFYLWKTGGYMSEQDEKVSCFVSHKKVDSQRVHAWAGPAKTICCCRIKSTGVWMMWKERVQTEATHRNSFNTHSHRTDEAKPSATLTPGGQQRAGKTPNQTADLLYRLDRLSKSNGTNLTFWSSFPTFFWGFTSLSSLSSSSSSLQNKGKCVLLHTAERRPFDSTLGNLTNQIQKKNKHTPRLPRCCHLHHHQNPSLAFSKRRANHQQKRVWEAAFTSFTEMLTFRQLWGSYQWRLLPRHQARRPLHWRRVVLLFFILWILHTYTADTDHCFSFLFADL